MQLLIAIVQAEDADLLIDRLVTQEYRVTRIDSTGSFLMRGNATILIGVENGRVEPVLSTIRAICRYPARVHEYGATGGGDRRLVGRRDAR